MVDAATAVLAVARIGVMLLAAGVTWVSYKAYRRSGIDYLLTATYGFAVITVGVFIEGVLFNLTTLDLTTVHIVESVAIGIGLLLLHRSLRA